MKPGQVNFASVSLPDGSERVELRELTEPGLFRKAQSKAVNREAWVRLAPPGGMAALSRMRTLHGGDAILDDELGAVIPPAVVSQLTELEALSLGLPPATNLTLQLRSSGSLNDGTIAVEGRWLRRGGVIVRANVAGARVRETSSVARLPEPLFSTWASLQRLQRADTGDSKRAAFAELREILGDQGSKLIEPDGFISQVRIAVATNFSLDLRTQSGLFDFDPVLFSRSVAENEDGDIVDAKSASLLTDFEQQKFRASFRSQRGGRRSYLLSDGTILYLDPNLGRALDVVREKQSAPADERRLFARSPQKYIREALDLDQAGDDEAADRLFIETQQYSDRVAGIETWQKPVLPWIKPAPNSWLPESFGLRIGAEPDVTFVELNPGEARELEGAIAEAIKKGEEHTAFRTEQVPATHAAMSAAKAIADLEDEIAHATDDVGSGTEPKIDLPTYFLKVGENFEKLDYSRIVGPTTRKSEFKPPAMPAAVKSIPKPHQVEGFAWLAEGWHRRLPGILLADDMGLGKTFQALKFLAWLRQTGDPTKPVLIVAPTGLLRNWRAEIDLHLEHDALGPIVEAFGGNLKYLREESGNDIRGGTSKLDVARWSEAGVVLTTFETMRDYHMSFARLPFSAVVFDEIQKLKNPASQMTRAAKTLNARIQVGMTGTPVENKLQDLWSISDVLYPGFLGTSREFEGAYPADSADALKALQSHIIERDGELPPFMLRRMKEDILTGLPKKSLVTYEEKMPAVQAAAYDHALARARSLRQSGDKGAMLKILHMLRSTSLHPQAPVGLSDFNEYIGASARLKKTFQLLDQIASAGEKALIFCEDLDMQAFLAVAVQERFKLARPVAVINGSVEGSKRQTIVTDFQTRPLGFDVMVLSPKAGGVGLTITAANHVIHLSRWWNPAVEDQATDRAYRIGQDKPVTVHIPMAVHPDEVIGPSSFDIRLNNLMERKRALSRGLLVPPESDADIETMLSAVLDGEEGPSNAEQVTNGLEPNPPVEDREAEADLVAVTEYAEPEGPQHSDGEDLPAKRVLSIQQSPVDVAEKRTPEIRRVVYAMGGTRDWSIFTQYINDEEISHLHVIDPYCCGNEASRRRLVDFIVRLATSASGLSNLEITSFDADSLNDCRENNQEQRLDLERQLDRKLPDVPVRHIQKSRRSGGDLHDRSVIAELSKGERIVWDLGRGIDGVMTAKYNCVVNAVREPLSSI